MNAYEKIITRMRSESKNAELSYQLMLGTMLSKDKISLGDITLDSSLYVTLDRPYVCDCKVISNCSHSDCSIENKVEDKRKWDLKKGDVVLVAPVSDEMYVLIGKVV